MQMQREEIVWLPFIVLLCQACGSDPAPLKAIATKADVRDAAAEDATAEDSGNDVSLAEDAVPASDALDSAQAPADSVADASVTDAALDVGGADGMPADAAADVTLVTCTDMDGCDDANPCTTDVCDSAAGCLHTNNAADCDADGSACTAGDACTAGACKAGPAASCDDGNVCTTDACIPAKGCVNLPGPVTASCDTDGLPCTEEACSGSGECSYKGLKSGTCAIGQGNAVECYVANAPDPQNPCALCEPQTNQTAWTPRPVGAVCGPDVKVCIRHVCGLAGSCEPSPDATLCPPSAVACAMAACDPTFGCKSVPLPKEATCAGSDGVGCTVEHCDGKSSCDNKPVADNGLCDDGFACTLDLCAPLGCTHGTCQRI